MTADSMTRIDVDSDTDYSISVEMNKQDYGIAFVKIEPAKTPVLNLDRELIDIGDLGDWGDWKELLTGSKILGRDNWPRLNRRLHRTNATPIKVRIVGKAKFTHLTCVRKGWFGNSCEEWSRTPKTLRLDLTFEFSKASPLTRAHETIDTDFVSWINFADASLRSGNFSTDELVSSQTERGQGTVEQLKKR